MKPAVDDPAQRGARLEQDERMTGQRARVHRTRAAQGRLGGGNRYELIAKEGRDGQLAVADRQAHDADVELVGDDGARDLGGVAGDDDDLRLGVARAEAPQRGRQQVDADRRAGAEPHASGHHAAQLLHALDAGLQLAQRAIGVGQQQLAGPRGERALAHALEQREAERLLEVAHLHADGGLGEVERLRRAREGAVARDGLQRAQVRDLEVHRQKIRDRQHQNN